MPGTSKRISGRRLWTCRQSTSKHVRVPLNFNLVWNPSKKFTSWWVARMKGISSVALKDCRNWRKVRSLSRSVLLPSSARAWRNCGPPCLLLKLNVMCRQLSSKRSRDQAGRKARARERLVRAYGPRDPWSRVQTLRVVLRSRPPRRLARRLGKASLEWQEGSRKTLLAQS